MAWGSAILHWLHGQAVPSAPDSALTRASLWKEEEPAGQHGSHVSFLPLSVLSPHLTAWQFPRPHYVYQQPQ